MCATVRKEVLGESGNPVDLGMLVLHRFFFVPAHPHFEKTITVDLCYIVFFLE